MKKTAPVFLQKLNGPTTLYVVGCFMDGKISNPTKVGITKDLDRRICTLQSHSPLTLEIVWSIELPSRDIAFAVEVEFQEKNLTQRLHGEWYEIHPDDVVRIVAHIVQRHLGARS